MFMFKSWKLIVCFIIQRINIFSCELETVSVNPTDELIRVETYDTGYPTKTIYDKDTLFVMPVGFMSHGRTVKLNELKCAFLYIVKLHMHMNLNYYNEINYDSPYTPLDEFLFIEEIAKMINIMLNEHFLQIKEFWLVNFYAHASKVYFDAKREGCYGTPKKGILEMHDFVFDEITKYLRCSCHRENAFNFDYEANLLAKKYPAVLIKNAHKKVVLEVFAIRRNKKLLDDLIKNINTSRMATNKDIGMKFNNDTLNLSKNGKTDSSSDRWFCSNMVLGYIPSINGQIVCDRISELTREVNDTDLSGIISLGNLHRAILDVLKIIILRTQWRFVENLKRLFEKNCHYQII